MRKGRQETGKLFGANLAYHRNRQGLTQAVLAERAGMSEGYLGHLERGRRDPTLSTLGALSQALGVQPGELLVRREQNGGQESAEDEIRQLLAGRPELDLRLVIRLARAAFEDQRLK